MFDVREAATNVLTDEIADTKSLMLLLFPLVYVLHLPGLGISALPSVARQPSYKLPPNHLLIPECFA